MLFHKISLNYIVLIRLISEIYFLSKKSISFGYFLMTIPLEFELCNKRIEKKTVYLKY